MKKLLTLTALLSLFFGCIAFDVQAQKAEEYKKRIEEINKLMKEALLTGQPEASISYYADDAVSMPDEAPMILGKDAILKNNTEMMQSEWKIKEFATNTLQILPSGKHITEIGTYRLAFQGPGMPEPMEESGKYVTVWEIQENGELKIKVEIWNNDPKPEEHN